VGDGDKAEADTADGGSDETGQPETGQPDTAPPEDTGGALVPDIELSPEGFDAGGVAEGSTVEADFLVRNVGDAALHLYGGSSGWSLSPDPADVVLEPGESLALHLQTTAEVGSWVDALILTSNDPDETELSAPLAYEVADPCSWDSWVADDSCEGGWPGTGVDGDVSLTGDFAPAVTTLRSAAEAASTLEVADGTGFATDDEVFGWAPDGTWILGRVVSAGATSLELSEAVSLPMGAAIQRVPHYREVAVDVDVSGTLVVFRACGAVDLTGTLSADGGGHPGGPRATGIPEHGWQGTSELGSGIQDDAPNGTAGGGGAESCNVHADGGGGGHATEGSQGGDYASYHCGGPGGQGGGTIGDELLTSGVFVGGGGGGGYYDTDAGVGGYGGEGGAGGGLVRIVALDGFAGAGSITARGADGEDGYWPDRYTSPGGGGGGAGGTILLVGDGSVSLDASGGVGGEGSEAGQHLTAGGTGGDGRIRVDGAWSGTSSPEAVSGCD